MSGTRRGCVQYALPVHCTQHFTSWCVWVTPLPIMIRGLQRHSALCCLGHPLFCCLGLTAQTLPGTPWMERDYASAGRRSASSSSHSCSARTSHIAYSVLSRRTTCAAGSVDFPLIRASAKAIAGAGKAFVRQSALCSLAHWSFRINRI